MCQKSRSNMTSNVKEQYILLYKNNEFDTILFFTSIKAINILRLKIVLKLSIFPACAEAEKRP